MSFSGKIATSPTFGGVSAAGSAIGADKTAARAATANHSFMEYLYILLDTENGETHWGVSPMEPRRGAGPIQWQSEGLPYQKLSVICFQCVAGFKSQWNIFFLPGLAAGVSGW